jgi:proline iminopeptidase
VHIWNGNRFYTPYLFRDLVTKDLSKIDKFEVPVILIEGHHDRNVNSDIAAEWSEKVKAPEKHLIWSEDSGHMPMTEEPATFLIRLVRYARPIAERRRYRLSIALSTNRLSCCSQLNGRGY